MIPMKAVRIHQYGDADVLVYEDAPRPQPGPREVLLRVMAAGVNPVDWKMREGQFKSFQTLPLILGIDVSGMVEAVGAEVTTLEVGQAVYGTLKPEISGAYAEYAIGDERALSPKPSSLTHIEAAAVPVAAMTAWQALFDKGGLSQNQTVLIHAVAGGVGSFAVQLAKWQGAHVVGTASARHRDFVDNQLGLDTVIDYQTTPFETVVKNVDLVMDTIGGETRSRSWAVLKPGGKLVSIVRPAPEVPPHRNDLSGDLVFLTSSRALLTQLSQLIEAGQIRPYVKTVFSLDHARDAHELSQSQQAQGKVVLKVANDDGRFG
jgi:NADPH:quinone reductase-like Zn-dependent oxidoreductase